MPEGAQVKRGDELGERRVKAEGAVPDAAIGAQAAAAGEPCPRMAGEEIGERAERAWFGFGIGIEKPAQFGPASPAR